MCGNPYALLRQRRRQRAVGDARHVVGGRRRPGRHPGVEIDQQRPQRRIGAQRIARLRADAGAVAGAVRASWRAGSSAHWRRRRDRDRGPGCRSASSRTPWPNIRWTNSPRRSSGRCCSASQRRRRQSVLPVTVSVTFMSANGNWYSGRPAGDVLAVGAHRLGEAVVHEQAAAAGLPVEDAVERLRGTRRRARSGWLKPSCT